MNMTLVNNGLVFLDIMLFFIALYTVVTVAEELHGIWRRYKARKAAVEAETTD